MITARITRLEMRIPVHSRNWVAAILSSNVGDTLDKEEIYRDPLPLICKVIKMMIESLNSCKIQEDPHLKKPKINHKEQKQLANPILIAA